MKRIWILAAVTLLMTGCMKKQVQLIDAANFNKEVNGKQVTLVTLHNGDVTMQVTNYGGRVVALWTPDKRGSYEDVVLGFDHIDKYLNNNGERFLGAVVGRCANRIANGKFTLNDTEVQLTCNDGPTTYHGGETGTDRMVWDIVSSNDSSLVMNVVLPDGQDGFPGNLDVTVAYTLTAQNEFRIDYAATTDKPTLCNLTNECFFNLKGEEEDILKHQLKINSKWALSIDENKIPDGKFISVKNTPFNFIEQHCIADSIKSKNEQLANGQGFDHNWIISRSTPAGLDYAATLFEPKSRRVVEVYTDQMGLQVNSGNFFDGHVKGKWGQHKYRGGIALETQNFPDAINQENFSVKPVLNPGETYTHTCVYKFGIAPKNE